MLARAVRLLPACAALALLSAPAAPAATGDCYSSAGCVEDARSARAFVDSVGVNTSLGSSQSAYWQQWPTIRARLLELGVSHIRDGTLAVGYPEIIAPTVAARFNDLHAAAGIRGNLLVGAEQSHGTTLAQRLAWIRTNVPAFTASVEGTNESGEDTAAIRAMQCELYSRAKADPVLAPKPVVGPSGGPPFSMSVWYDRVGDLSACMDRGNLHPYPGADPPHRHQERDLGVAFLRGRTTYGDRPQWITETGYWNNSADVNNVSEAASGVYVPRAFMENFRRGVERTQAFELIDRRTGSTQAIDNYGLLRSDGVPKPAFNALRNMLRVVGDGAGASGSLGFGIVCHTNCRYGHPDAWPTQDGPIRHLLLRKSTGAYLLAVWSESRIWDPATRRDIPKPPQGFTLRLHAAPAKVEVFDPGRGISPISTDASGATALELQATDGVRLIVITPRTEAPAGTAATAFEAESMTSDPAAYARVEADPSASGGSRLMVWHYATASRALTTSAHTGGVVVRARGDQCQEASGVRAPRMTLRVDGAPVGTHSVPGEGWADHAFAVSVPAGAHTFSLSYDNDYEDARCNRNLYLDRVALEAAPPPSFEAESMTSDPAAYARVEADPSASGGSRLMVWHYATASRALTTSAHTSGVVVRARGDQCQEASGVRAPRMTLRVDGAPVGTRSVPGEGWADYAFAVSVPAGARTFSLSYDNDYEDARCNRNLYLDRVGLGAVPPG